MLQRCGGAVTRIWFRVVCSRTSHALLLPSTTHLPPPSTSLFSSTAFSRPPDMARAVATRHSDSGSDQDTRGSLKKDNAAFRDAMDVDEENGDGSGKEEEEEYEIEKILDAKIGMFPSVRSTLVLHVTNLLTHPNKGSYGLPCEVERIRRRIEQLGG